MQQVLKRSDACTTLSQQLWGSARVVTGEETEGMQQAHRRAGAEQSHRKRRECMKALQCCWAAGMGLQRMLCRSRHAARRSRMPS